MDQPTTLAIFELAAGSGMLGHGVKLALDVLGLHAEVAGAVEWDSEAAAVLLAGLDVAQGYRPPVYDDAKRWFGRHAWRDCRRLEPVDVVVAGYPCQPFSHAGKRGGAGDPRHLWPAVRRAVAGLQPRIVFFENVEGHLSLGSGKVLADMRRLGFRTSCGMYSAEEVGASQLRKRLFILGVANSVSTGVQCEVSGWTGGTERDAAGRPGEAVAIGHGQRRETCLPVLPEQRTPTGCHPVPIFPPGPHDYDAWADALVDGLDPSFCPAVERGVPVVADGLATRTSLLRIGGNGVVPLCAARAFIELFACCMDELVDPSEAGPLFDFDCGVSTTSIGARQ